MIDLERIRTNLSEVQERIDQACVRSGRGDAPRLLVASKYLTSDEMSLLRGAGIRLVGRTGQMGWRKSGGSGTTRSNSTS